MTDDENDSETTGHSDSSDSGSQPLRRRPTRMRRAPPTPLAPLLLGDDGAASASTTTASTGGGAGAGAGSNTAASGGGGGGGGASTSTGPASRVPSQPPPPEAGGGRTFRVAVFSLGPGPPGKLQILAPVRGTCVVGPLGLQRHTLTAAVGDYLCRPGPSTGDLSTLLSSCVVCSAWHAAHARPKHVQCSCGRVGLECAQCDSRPRCVSWQSSCGPATRCHCVRGASCT